MKLAELINRLKHLQNQHGDDIRVVIPDQTDWDDGYKIVKTIIKKDRLPNIEGYKHRHFHTCFDRIELD